MAKRNEKKTVEHLKVTQNLNVVTVSLNRPEKRNAFFPEMIDELKDTFTELGQDKSLRAVVLTAEGASFCSGGDLQWMKSMADYSLKQNLADAGRLYDMFWAIYSCPVPVIARAFGHAFGGGAGLLAVSDIVICENATQICFSEVKWGLVPAVISPFVVNRCAVHAVYEWFLTAKVFSVAEAKAGGLVSASGTIDEVDAQVEATLNNILKAAPGAVRRTKKLLHDYNRKPWAQVKKQVTQLIAERRVSEEGQKGLQAFLNRQDPQWSEPIYATAPKEI